MKRPLTLKSRLLLLAIAAAAAAGLYRWSLNATAKQTPSDAAAQTIPVQAAVAVTQHLPHMLSGLGTVTAASRVTVRSRVEGELVAIHFHEGEEVSAGQLLAEIDPRPFQVTLAQAQGQLEKDRATLDNARRDLTRYDNLAKTSLVSRQALDAQRSQVDEAQGTVKASEGAVASAQLNLTYSRVLSPIAGRVGLKQIDVGNYISSGDSSGLLVITQTKPIDVLFSLAENHLDDILQAQKRGVPPIVEVWDRRNEKRLAEGTLLSIDNQIDTTTGTLKMKARFANQDEVLFPNQFVNVRLQVNLVQDALVIPAAALQISNEGYFVWLINPQNKVSKRQVTAGLQVGQRVAILTGIAVGDRVVTDGLDRLRDDSTVEVLAPQRPQSAEQTGASR